MARRKKRDDPESEDYIDPEAPRSVLTYRNSRSQPVVVPHDIAFEMDRIYRCHERSLSGETWTSIARDEGFSSASACKATVDRYMEEARALIAEDTGKRMLQREIETLNYMQTKIWPQVENGDLRAVDQVMKLMSKRVEWQNLAITDDNSRQELLTMIVPGQTYQGYLEEMARRQSIESSTTVTSTASPNDPPEKEQS